MTTRDPRPHFKTGQIEATGCLSQDRGAKYLGMAAPSILFNWTFKISKLVPRTGDSI